MSKYKLVILAITLLLAGFLGGYFVSDNKAKREARSEKISEVIEEVQNSEKVAKSFEKPALVYFFAKDCSSCQKFKPNWQYLKRKYKNKFHFIEIDVDNSENARYSIEFMVTTIPQVFLEDAPFRNRVFLNPIMYHYMPRFQDDLDRYLEMRELLKKGAS